MMRSSVCQSGFTYLWVMLLVSLMGLGLVIAAEVQSTATRRDKEKELLAIGRQFRLALSSYLAAGAEPGATAQRPDAYPTSLESLLKDERSLATKRHLRKIFIDPMTGKAEWGVVRLAGRIVGVYSLSKQQPIKQAGFEPEDSRFAGKDHYSDWVFSYPSDIQMTLAQGQEPTSASGEALRDGQRLP